MDASLGTTTQMSKNGWMDASINDGIILGIILQIGGKYYNLKGASDVSNHRSRQHHTFEQ
jgi:hypothetical protein